MSSEGKWVWDVWLENGKKKKKQGKMEGREENFSRKVDIIGDNHCVMSVTYKQEKGIHMHTFTCPYPYMYMHTLTHTCL